MTYREPDRRLVVELEAELAAAHKTIADLRIENEILKSRIAAPPRWARRIRLATSSPVVSTGVGAGLGLFAGAVIWSLSGFDGILVLGPVLGLLGGGFVWLVGVIPAREDRPEPPMMLPPGR